jgi:hypothetical protein
MLRYHKDVYMNPGHFKGLQTFTDRLNWLKWGYSGHCLENLKYRAIDLESILKYIRDLKLESGQIFEYYINDLTNEPEKVCYRVAYNPGIDLVLVINQYKEIITIYINSANDKHETLKKELYQRA